VSELDAKIHQLASESRDAYATFRQLIEEKGQERVSAKSAGAKAETAPNPVGPDGYLIDAPPPEKGVVIAAPVNIKAIKAQLAPVVKSMESTWAKVKLESSAPYTAMKALLSRPDVVPLFDAEEALGAFKSITRGAEADLFTQGQGRAASVISQLDREIRTKAAAVSPEAAEALVEGRRLTHSKFVTAEVKDLLRADEPGNLYKQLVQGQDTAVNRLKMVQQEAPTAMPQIGRAVVESMLTKMTEMGGFKQAASVLAEWRRIGPQTKELLIPDAQVRQQITNWLVAAERVGEIENKSGTGKARAIMTTKATLGAAGGMLMSGMPAAALGTVGGVILGEAASVGIAKALRNPNVIRALTEDLVTPRRLRAGSNAGTWPAVGAASMIRQGSAELPAGATVEDRTRARLSTAPPRR
jgi:hypothetical protein